MVGVELMLRLLGEQELLLRLLGELLRLLGELLLRLIVIVYRDTVHKTAAVVLERDDEKLS